MDSAAVIKEIVRDHPAIQTCRFFSFSTATKLQDRLVNIGTHENLLITKAKAKKKQERIRFWAALLSIFVEEHLYNDTLLSEVFYHQPNRDYTYVCRADMGSFLAAKTPIPQAINSKVLMSDGSARHIPMLDFKVPSKEGHDTLVVECARALGLRGYLLDSGRSYHFIGGSLISESDLMDVLAKFILLDPISDKAWAAHQIIERCASLRISEMRGYTPLVVARV